MGFHLGVIAAECEWPVLHRALEGHCGTIEDEGAVVGNEWLSDSSIRDVRHVVADGERCYAIDTGMVLSADSDLILAISWELSCTVVGAGAETVSSTFWFTAADSGSLRRLHFEEQTTLTCALDVGEPLSGESSTVWDDIDGDGLSAGLVALGFDPEVALDGRRDGRRLRWLGEVFPEPGELDERLTEHLPCSREARRRPVVEPYHSRPA